jgi:tetratricopeptide (TPR) repeat protein
VLQALIIAALVVWIYLPALHGDWLWDDGPLVADNAVVHDPSGLWKIWFEPGGLIDYQPLKVSVVWLQWRLWGADTLGYHLTNVVLHILSALLVWRLLGKFGLRLAWLGGLIFAIHPAQVESVAWIAELKNTLSLTPCLLAMCAWIDFDERGKRRDYFLALGLFLVAMLCKPTMVMFPVVILLYVWWKRGRIAWHDVRASTPFFVVSLALGLVTVWFLHHHAIGDEPIPMGGFFSRLACAGLALSFYFSTCFLPVGLLPIYPKWVIDPPTPAQFLPWPILLAAIFWLWAKRESWGRHALLGIGFFLINLAPFVGFNVASYMKSTWVMDHILYLPIIGWIGLVVAALGRMEERVSGPTRSCGIGLAAVAMVLLAWLSHADAGVYINSETLWNHTIEHTPGSAIAHNYLGLALLQSGREPEAIGEFKEALRLDPDYFEALNNLGNSLLRTGRVAEAQARFEQALRLKPDNAETLNNLGNIFYQTGRFPEAIKNFGQALQIKPDNDVARYNMANALVATNRLPEAIAQYEEVLRLKPGFAEAHGNLGAALQQAGRLPEAMEQYGQALQLQPDNADAHYNLGLIFSRMGRTSDAMTQFEAVLRLKPDDADARNNLARLQAMPGTAPAQQ